MGFSLLAYLLLAITGTWIFQARQTRHRRPRWLRSVHYIIGGIMVGLVLLLLGIGLVGTLGYYGTLNHSAHFVAGLTVVGLVLISAWSATQISRQRPWARTVHLSINAVLFIAFAWVTWTGWSVVQKYLP